MFALRIEPHSPIRAINCQIDLPKFSSPGLYVYLGFLKFQVTNPGQLDQVTTEKRASVNVHTETLEHSCIVLRCIFKGPKHTKKNQVTLTYIL